MRVLNGDALFVKLYYIPGLLNDESPYRLSPMPGIKKGISGTILVGYNIGIINNINERKIEPAIEVIKYITSRKIQKELALKEIIISGITSLYEEDDVCSKIKYCELYKYPQTIIRPPNVFDSDNYYEKYTNYFFEFLYKNETAQNALKKMEDLTKFYNISLDSNETYLGIIMNISSTCFFILILSSISLMYMKKFKNDFYFLPNSFWYILIFGIEMILTTSFTKVGPITVVKCHLNCLLLTLSYSFIYVPLLYKLIITFPDNNKYSIWDIFVYEGENFKVCNNENNYQV
ncbi:hypothetical protein PIROE2DRAFT_17925 [Piromyces sp. E2]|nr:hypothetical protein PIROE2DRAFT_17925 [Piromyces sp. E2]|eukprot:OUM57165.1 hypothetical protein PIROE2DRAFT_17925 [Piromyces sp. E2]